MKSSPNLLRHTHVPVIEDNPIQRALDNYSDMERDLSDCMDKNRQLAVDNGALIAEVNMLRAALERSDIDRMRLQAVSAGLLGRLLAINDAIGGAVRTSLKEGIEAVETMKEDPALEQAAGEVAAIIQRVEPLRAPEAHAITPPPPAPPQAVGTALPEGVDWSRLPQGARA